MVLVDNGFSVPVAEGCGGQFSIDSVIDARLGLPARAGRNTAILSTSAMLAVSESVIESEG